MSERSTVATAIDSAVVLAAITALLYVASSAYYGGLLSASNLDPNLLDRSLYRSLYDGMLAVFSNLLLLTLFGGLACFLLSVMAIPAWLGKDGRVTSKELQAHLARRSNVLKHPIGQGILRLGETAAVWLLIIATLLLVTIITLVQVEKSGRSKGEEVLARVSLDQLEQRELMTVEIGGSKRRLVHLVCGAAYCAGMDPCSREVFYYEQGPRSFVNSNAIVPVICTAFGSSSYSSREDRNV